MARSAGCPASASRAGIEHFRVASSKNLKVRLPWLNLLEARVRLVELGDEMGGEEGNILHLAVVYGFAEGAKVARASRSRM